MKRYNVIILLATSNKYETKQSTVYVFNAESYSYSSSGLYTFHNVEMLENPFGADDDLDVLQIPINIAIVEQEEIED